MSSLDKLGYSLKQKLSLNDYNASTPQNSKAEIPKKVKLTVYLSESDINKLNEICAGNIKTNGKQDKSGVISRALSLLFKVEGI